MWSKDDVLYETRWTRVYEKAGEPRCQFHESRFQDRTATITLDELQRDWHQWPEAERIDFCQAFSWARIPDREDILRFLIQNGQHDVWGAIALLVAGELPSHESVPVLIRWCESCEIGRGANYFQALAFTGDREARDVLKRAFLRIWNSENLMDDATFCNWATYDAICCVEHLCELGDDREEYRAVYEQLKSHPSERTRENVVRRLAKYFPD